MVQDFQENYITGWVKLYRSFIKWEWFSVPNMVHVFIYCLIKTNHKDKKWRGIEIKRGSFITSLKTMSLETGLSVKMIRTALKNLEKTGEIVKQSGTQNTLITICNYDTYQSFNNVEGTQKANEGQTEGKQRATTNNDNNIKNDNILIPTTEKIRNIDVDYVQLFLKQWNETRTTILKKPSNINRLGYDERDEVYEIYKAYDYNQVHTALNGLFRQKTLPHGNTSILTSPKHFINNFERYYQAGVDMNPQLYGTNE